MMSLARVSTQMGRHYYKTESYYTHEKCVENSEWFGHGAAELALRGAVDAASFQSLLEGRAPRSKIPLNCERENGQSHRRAGTDLTFSAPKSVSLACLVGGDERLLVAHNASVDAALTVFQSRYSITRSGSKDDRRNDVTGNIIAAKFMHDTSRAKDPQLHTHCVVLNAVKRGDGAWRSLHNDPLFENSKLLGLIYQNELAQRVSTLGYDVRTVAGGTFEIEGYSEEQLRAFSKRRAKLEALGAENQKEARTLVKVDREKKGPAIPREILDAAWQSEAQTLGIVHPKCHEVSRAISTELETPELVRSGVRHASEHDVTFKREAVEKFLLENHLGEVSWRDIEHEISHTTARGELIVCQNQELTTREGMRIEEEILARIQNGKGVSAPIASNLPETIIQNTLGLTDGQREAITISLQTTDQFIAWQGVAGAGKTFAMNVVREIAESKNISIQGFAPSAEAAKVLEVESKIPATTVASLLTDKRRHEPKGETLWIVDEAGLLSARECHALIQKAELEKARVIFVGDTRQLSSVGAGNPFKLMQEKGIETAHLTESRRQKTRELKSAVSLLAEGKTEHAVTQLERQVHELRREKTRTDHVTKTYLQMDSDERSQTLILAGTNRERDLLTENIRGGLKQMNALGEVGILRSLRPRDLTPEQARSSVNLTAGDVVVFHRDFKNQGIKKGEAYEILSSGRDITEAQTQSGETIRFSPRKQPAFVVYEKHEAEFAVGDRVRWTRNDKTLGVRNGQDAIVSELRENQITVQNSDKKSVTLPLSSMQHLDHNYVNTVFSSQGKTCNNVIISTDRTFGKEAFYVAVSRARNSVKIFTEDKAEMMSCISKSKAKRSVLELVPERLFENQIAKELTVHQDHSQSQKHFRRRTRTR